MTLKSVADKLGIAILLIHHTRKEHDSDPFNMISGTTGLNGCADGSFVLTREKRSENAGTLHCTGRDIESAEIAVRFEGHRWSVTDEVESHKPDTFSFAVHDLMLEQVSFKGSASDLCKLLFQKFGGQYYPNRLTRDLIQHTEELKTLGVTFRSRRSHGCRIIELDYDESGDSKNGALLLVEVVDTTGTHNSENPFTVLIEAGDGKISGDGNSPAG